MNAPTPPPAASFRDARACVVSVIVVAYNSRRYCPRQRAALEAQTEERWRLIVVDNASMPEERIAPEDLAPGAELVSLDTNIGFAAANNLAAGRADTPFLALLNPDAFPEPGWLAELLRAAARHPECAAIGSTQICDHDETLLDGACDEMHAIGFPYRALHMRARSLLPPEGEAFSACAAAALYRTQDYRAAGGFDESFFCYCEDSDLGYRLRLMGRASYRASAAVVRHVGGGAGGGRNAFARYHGFRNRLWSFVKVTPPALFWALAPAHAVASVANAVFVSLKERDAACWRGLADAVRALPHIWRRRKAVQAARTAPVGALARALVWSPLVMLARGPKRR